MMIRFVTAMATFVFGSFLVFAVYRDGAPAPAAPAAATETTATAAGAEPATLQRASTTALLMAFIDTSDSTVNRSQAVLVRSIRDQYEPRGISVVVVQACGLQGEDECRNALFDWGLDQLTVLPDPEGKLAGAYSVNDYPTTLLLDDLGKPITSWTGYEPPANVGPMLRRIAGV